MKFVLAAFLFWRLALFIPTGQFSILPFANFDGEHYLSIAFNGYTFDGRFFPLYPLLIKLISFPFHSYEIYLVNGFLISNTFFFLSLILFYNLVETQYSEKLAKESIIWLLIFPTSFYFGSIYSESLFLFLSLAVFYFANQRKWLAASFSGLLLGVTRFIGVFILPSLTYELVTKEKQKKIFLIRLLPFMLVPLGIIAFSIFCFYKWGDPLYFIKAQGQLDNYRSVDTVVIPFQTTYRYFNILTRLPYHQYNFWIALLELSTFLFVSLLIYVAWKKNIDKSLIIFSLFSFLIPSLTGTFSGLPRYVITIFPIFITLALIKNKAFKFIYAAVSPILLLILLGLFSRGYFVA